MDEAIGEFCKSLATFCNHLQSSSDALKQSVDRRPVPLDSASTTFTQCLNRRVTTASTDLNLLESMSFGTVSFEELLGHCNEIFKKNQTHVVALQQHLQSSTSYIPSAEIDINIEEEDVFLDDPSPKYSSCLDYSSRIKDNDTLLDDSLSLKNLGISDVCLATIASEANEKIEMRGKHQPETSTFEMIRENTEEEFVPFEEPKAMIELSQDDYETLSKPMKSLVTWEDLLVAVNKVNSYLRTNSSKRDSFRQDEISSLQPGHKARSYLLLLIKLNRLIVETSEGLVSYRVVNSKQH